MRAARGWGGLRDVASAVTLGPDFRIASWPEAGVARGRRRKERGKAHRCEGGLTEAPGDKRTEMAKQDYYATLGVARDASGDDLKRAYRKLAMQFHPDRNPGAAQAEGRFKELNEAYDVLKDDQKRAAYDRFGHAAFEQGNGAAGFSQGFDFNSGDLGGIFDQVFGDFMGGGRRGRTRTGADIRQAVERS